MKKVLCLYTAFLLTFSLCACANTAAGNVPVRTTAAPESAEVPAVAIPPDAIRLKVSFGPEFEIVMTGYLRILMAIPGNAEAETLLTGLNLTDRSYCFAFDEVLAAALEQNLLKTGVTIHMSASAQDTSVWTNATKELLMQPVEALRQETGAIFGCHVSLPDTAPEQLDLSQLIKVERTTEEYHQISYPTGAVSGHNSWRLIRNYPDGSTMRWYAFSTREGSLTIHTNPDGRCEYSQLNGNTLDQVWESPDGYGYREIKGTMDPNTNELAFEFASGFESFDGGYYFEETYGADNFFTCRTREYPDGSREEMTFYDSGEIRTQDYTAANGDSKMWVFYKNGNVESFKREGSEGYYEEQQTEDGMFVYQKFADAGMTNVREVFFTDGKPTKVIIDGVVHEDRETLNQFG